MCGISGIIHNDTSRNVSKKELETITDNIAHRGPDGYGYWFHNNIALGHRRLSIIDLEGSVQPMSTDFENFIITYNGEIYNYLEIKNELLKLGHQFKTTGDTEVILKSYQEWGSDCLDKFRGMFAFAIVDKTKEEVFIARDHFGIKPLLYYKGENSFVFGSEIQQFTCFTNFKKEIVSESINDYLRLGYIPAPNTIYKNLFKLEPGHFLRVSYTGKVLEHKEYYDIEFSIDKSKSDREWEFLLEEAIDTSVRYHKIADVPLGTFLSGGIDSSLIASSLSKFGNNVDAFTMGFDQKEVDETPYAKQVAKQFNLKHHIEKIDMSDMLDIFPRLIQHYGEPFSDSSAIPTYYISKRIRKHLPVVLSGDGGDEAFGGYWSYQNFLKIAYPNAPKDIHRIAIKKILKILGKTYPSTPRKPSLEDWMKLISPDNSSLFHNLMNQDFKELNSRDVKVFDKWYQKAKQNQLGLFETISYLDYKTYIHSDILTKVDVASMMNSLEVRTPLIDKEIIGIASKMPSKFKIGQTRNGAWRKKIILNNIAEKRFGSEFTKRKKQGFVVPLNNWFSEKNELGNDYNKIITNKSSSIYQYFDYKLTNVFLKNGGNFNPNMKYQLYFLEKWLNS